MAKFQVSIDDAEVLTMLAGMDARARDLTPAMRDIGEMLRTSVDRRFETATDPDGKPWAPLAPSTVKAKAKAGHELILQWSGRLRQAVQGTPIAADATSVTLAITNVVYAAIHQFGGSISHGGRVVTLFRSLSGIRAGDNRFVKKSKATFASDHWKGQSVQTIPARPYMGINAADLLEATRIIRAFITAPVTP